MISEFSAALTSLKGSGEILKATKDLHNSTEYIAAVSEIDDKLHAALVKSISSLEKVDSLNARIADLTKEITDHKD